MTIAYIPNGLIGVRASAPIGPIDTVNGPNFNQRPGTTVLGDGGARFILVRFTATNNQVLNQGDLMRIDNNFVGTLLATSGGALGASVGTFFCAGNYLHAPPDQMSPFSYTFSPAGDYAVWVQVGGTSLLNCASTALTAKTVTTSTTAGRADAPTAGPAGGSYTLFGVFLPATNYTFTATTVNGSPVLTSVSTLTGIYPNQTITGTGIPASTTIASIDPKNNTVTLSANATANGSTITMTCARYVEVYLNNGPFMSALN